MVRLHIPPGAIYELQSNTEPASSISIEGPYELLRETVSIGGEFVSSGEFILVGVQWEQMLPYLREELAISLPICLVLTLLMGLTWMRRAV